MEGMLHMSSKEKETGLKNLKLRSISEDSHTFLRIFTRSWSDVPEAKNGELQIPRESKLSPEAYTNFIYESYMNIMTMVAECGTPDLYIKFTANPNWPEVEVGVFFSSISKLYFRNFESRE